MNNVWKLCLGTPDPLSSLLALSGATLDPSRLSGGACPLAAARIDPLWIERLAGHLVKRHYSEPRWEKKRGSAVATESVEVIGTQEYELRKGPFLERFAAALHYFATLWAVSAKISETSRLPK